MYDKDLTGKVFGRLIVLELDHLEENGAQVWKCKCSCPEGNIVTATRKGLIAGTKKSCGCLFKELLRESRTTHGMSNTRFYDEWNKINQRCSNPNNDSYYVYGLRGITVCG